MVIMCNTQQPYRHCLEVPSSSQGIDVLVRGIRFEHSSKSVANNYCVFAQVCLAALSQQSAVWRIICVIAGAMLAGCRAATNCCSCICTANPCQCCVLQAGSLEMEECDVTSQSGVGVGVEGAAATLNKCSIHDCERHGVAVFGSLEGEGALLPTSCQQG